jgi:lipid II:glycine glycyltransferase (peptidoglycan interpeptide bridge formation enzyme)
MESALKTREIDAPADRPAMLDQSLGLSGAIRVEWDDTPRRKWDLFCQGSSFSAYQQSFAYGEALAEMGVRIIRASLYRQKTLIGVAQVQVRKLLGFLTVAHIMRGPVWSSDGVSDVQKCASLEAMRASLPVKGLHAFVVFPEGATDAGLKGAGYKRIMGGYHTVLLDLTPDEDVLAKGLHGKWRNRLKASEKAEMTITPMSKRPDKYAWLLDKEGDQQKLLRYRSKDAAITRHYQSVLGKGSILAFEAKEGAERIGGMLFLRHGDDATYHIGWASDKGKDLNVHNRLLWHAIKALKKAGVRTLDLGGVNTDYNPGIARFKIGTGGKVLSLSGAWTKGPRWK